MLSLCDACDTCYRSRDLTHLQSAGSSARRVKTGLHTVHTNLNITAPCHVSDRVTNLTSIELNKELQRINKIKYEVGKRADVFRRP